MESLLLSDVRYHLRGRDGWNRSRHLHTETVELLFIHSDGGEILLGNYHYMLKKNMIFIVPPRVMHATLPQPAEQYARSVLTLSAKRLQKILAYSDFPTEFSSVFREEKGLPILLDKPTAERMDKLFHDLVDPTETPYHKGIDMARCLEILGLCMQCYTQQKNKDKGKITLSGVVSYIQNHYAEPLTLGMFADMLHITPYHLCRLFKKETGMTVMEYLLEIRLQKASELLKNTGLLIAQIAFDSGFSDESYFCRAFRRSKGISPSAYRKVKQEQSARPFVEV